MESMEFRESAPRPERADLTDRFERGAAEALLPTRYGALRIVGFDHFSDGGEHAALLYGELSPGDAPLVRIHSECLTGDVFGSLRCDCGPQLDLALRTIVAAGSGVVLYLRQEGRGIGLLNKIRAYALQERGLDTVEANEALGLAADAREYGTAATMLHQLGLPEIRLLSNNPAKIAGIERFGIRVLERVPLLIEPLSDNLAYLSAKERKMGHLYRVSGPQLIEPVVESTEIA